MSGHAISCVDGRHFVRYVMMHQTEALMARFSSSKFLAHYFPDIAGLCGLMTAYGFDPPQVAAVEKWRSRGAVPGAWLPVVLGVLELEHGGPVSMLPFIER